MPAVLTNIGRSDHNEVEKSRTNNRGEDVMVVVRSQDSKGRAMLGQAIMNTDWTPLYHLETCDEIKQLFYSTVTALVDYYLPLMTVTHHKTDKPWITDQFRCLIRCRQNVLKNGQVAPYKAYRN